MQAGPDVSESGLHPGNPGTSGHPGFLNNQGYQTFLHIGFESGKPGLRTRVPWFFNQAWTRVKPWFDQALGARVYPDCLSNFGWITQKSPGCVDCIV